MNECVIDRGGSSTLITLDVYCNGFYLTSVAADGIILASPTGSTAYSMSAGGPIVHPTVGCVILTPICPFSLSFRPLVLPDSAELRIMAAKGGRAVPRVSIDGREKAVLGECVSVIIKSAMFPYPTIVPARPESCQTPTAQHNDDASPRDGLSTPSASAMKAEKAQTVALKDARSRAKCRDPWLDSLKEHLKWNVDIVDRRQPLSDQTKIVDSA
eukprot:Selendium_serpulae@DN5950_c0_g3_i2.p1